jgi:hypothetical protein
MQITTHCSRTAGGCAPRCHASPLKHAVRGRRLEFRPARVGRSSCDGHGSVADPGQAEDESRRAWPHGLVFPTPISRAPGSPARTFGTRRLDRPHPGVPARERQLSRRCSAPASCSLGSRGRTTRPPPRRGDSEFGSDHERSLDWCDRREHQVHGLSCRHGARSDPMKVRVLPEPVHSRWPAVVPGSTGFDRMVGVFEGLTSTVDPC